MNATGRRASRNPEHELRTLNELIDASLERVRAYEQAAERMRSLRFDGFFSRRAAQRSELAQRLQNEVRRLGGVAEQPVTQPTTIHRLMLGVRGALRLNDKTMLRELELGENALSSLFESAIEDEQLSLPVRRMLLSSYHELQDDSERMRTVPRHREAPLAHRA